jgi:hypothetical protein
VVPLRQNFKESDEWLGSTAEIPFSNFVRDWERSRKQHIGLLINSLNHNNTIFNIFAIRSCMHLKYTPNHHLKLIDFYSHTSRKS